MSDVTFSFIVPTKGRPESLRIMCDSVRLRTRRLDRVEIVLVIDDNDSESLAFEYPGLQIRKVTVPPGSSMGRLNMAGYRASSGRYIMLMNDDVGLGTDAWDERVLEIFQSFPDGIVLVHVNDGIFGQKLCTFPFLTRTFCELAGGICPEGYLRYRIDDHIHNVFDLLVELGYRRRIYVPDVVFQHANLTETEKGHDYVPDPEIHAIDTDRFEALLPERKRLALRANDTILRYSQAEDVAVWEDKLAPITDSVAIRHPHNARVWSANAAAGDRARVTVAVVSANVQSDLTRRCIERLKAHTTNYDLIVVDNNRSADFNHSREMNRLMEFCRTDYLVLMDDDVLVEEGWLEGLMLALTPGVGVVTPVHKDRNGAFSYAGVVMQPDDTGHHTHVMEIPAAPVNIQTLCSAIMLIDMPRCGRVRLDETFTKYFLDIDYGLRIWEEGFRVVCSPWSLVTHIGGGTLAQGSERGVDLFEKQRLHYVSRWVHTRRIHDLRRGLWRGIPEFMELTRFKDELDALLLQAPGISPDAALARSRILCSKIDHLPAFKNYIADQARLAIGDRGVRVDDPRVGSLVAVLGVFGQPVLYEAGFHGMNIVLWNDRFYALPGNEGVFDYERMRAGGYSRSYEAAQLADIKIAITQSKGESPKAYTSADREPRKSRAAAPPSTPPPVAIQLDPQGARRSPLVTLKRAAGLVPYLGVLHPPSRRVENLFDPDFYLRTYPEVAASSINPLVHFMLWGAFEGRQPHPLFDTRFYIRKYPDVAAAGVNPLAHYLRFGAFEERQPHPLFDPKFYLDRNPQVRKERLNPLLHYLLHGGAEGRQPHPLFDPKYYLNHCPEARLSGANPLLHFLASDGADCGNPNPAFDCAAYLRENPDVARRKINPLVHYVQFGMWRMTAG